jgi:hypothetical protein
MKKARRPWLLTFVAFFAALLLVGAAFGTWVTYRSNKIVLDVHQLYRNRNSMSSGAIRINYDVYCYGPSSGRLVALQTGKGGQGPYDRWDSFWSVSLLKWILDYRKLPGRFAGRFHVGGASEDFDPGGANKKLKIFVKRGDEILLELNKPLLLIQCDEPNDQHAWGVVIEDR